jgi:hypothetical protein
MGTRLDYRSVVKGVLQTIAAALIPCLLIGCGSKSQLNIQTGGAVPSAPAIVQQPTGVSVPMGLTATYFVEATGNPLNYQWNKNGIAIPDANSPIYTTPTTAFADTGSVFTVSITNSLGSATSVPVTLTVTARAPEAGDLRFQQVDAASTVNGYGNGPTGFASAIPGRGGAYFGLSIGSPLYMSPIVCGQPPVPSGEGCEWPFEQFYLPGNLMALGLSTGYGADFFTNFEADLQSSTFPAGGSPISSSNSVVTSLDLEAPDNLFAASWIQSQRTSGFNMSQQTVSLSDFQSAATQEGINSRVITAVTYNAGQVVYLSYSWQDDMTSVYETSVASASVEAVESAAANLAAQGYIITALGGSNLNNSYLLVGTRVKGDTMPRPLMVVPGPSGESAFTALIQPGYALVGILQDTQGNPIYLGER